MPAHRFKHTRAHSKHVRTNTSSLTHLAKAASPSTLPLYSMLCVSLSVVDVIFDVKSSDFTFVKICTIGLQLKFGLTNRAACSLLHGTSMSSAVYTLRPSSSARCCQRVAGRPLSCAPAVVRCLVLPCFCRAGQVGVVGRGVNAQPGGCAASS